MLLNALVRPVANNLCKIPSRSTSAVVGAKSRHVPIAVSINHGIIFFLKLLLIKSEKCVLFSKNV